jgi:hypothetical protein
LRRGRGRTRARPAMVGLPIITASKPKATTGTVALR